jgi:hypothetical protein
MEEDINAPESLVPARWLLVHDPPIVRVIRNHIPQGTMGTGQSLFSSPSYLCASLEVHIG